MVPCTMHSSLPGSKEGGAHTRSLLLRCPHPHPPTPRGHSRPRQASSITHQLAAHLHHHHDGRWAEDGRRLQPLVISGVACSQLGRVPAARGDITGTRPSVLEMLRRQALRVGASKGAGQKPAPGAKALDIQLGSLIPLAHPLLSPHFLTSESLVCLRNLQNLPCLRLDE